MLKYPATIVIVALMGAAMSLGAPQAAQKGDKEKHRAHFEKCALECNNCQRACDDCALHCASMLAEGKKEHRKTLETCLDCADHCAAAARIVSRQGPFSALICKACAEACARCGKECERFPDDARMKQCAQECRKCEQACNEMLRHAGAAAQAERR